MNSQSPLRPGTQFRLTAEGELVVEEAAAAVQPRALTQFAEDEERVMTRVGVIEEERRRSVDDGGGCY